jgi:hypothetical protein
MKQLVVYVDWALAVLGVMLAPAILVFGVPFAYGIGSDIVEHVGWGPVALILAFTAGVAARRRVAQRWPAMAEWVLRRRAA